MIAGLVGHWLDRGRLELPLPASGHTGERWSALSRLAEEDIVAARVAEAHVDAVAILHELGGKPPASGQLWAVWAAESSESVVTAGRRANGEYTLSGAKPWCSGAGFCTHALVTGRGDDGRRGLFAIELTEPAVRPLPSTWCNQGMIGSDTRRVQFSAAHAIGIGDADEYLMRPGFWHGAIGVAACWLGGARAVARPLYCRARDEKADPHALAHLGAVDAVLAAAQAMLDAAAVHIDADPFDRAGTAELWARRTRAVIEHAVEETVNRSGRALGPGPLCHDPSHAQRVADLTIYVRQSHAERDLAALGQLTGKHL
jgi:alkylation response protein AidB-like acyl-CoA dehydrogenase